MAQKKRTANLQNVRATIQIAESYEGTLVSIKGRKSGIDVFVHYDLDGTFSSASVWNGNDWIHIPEPSKYP